MKQQGSYNAPAAMGQKSHASYMSRSMAPKHSVWGHGSRVTGRSLLCQAGPQGTTSFDAIGQWNVTIPSGGYVNTYTFGLHPTYIDRLGFETNLYSLYCYRELIITYVPMCATSTAAGFIMSLTMDNIQCAKIDQTYAANSPPAYAAIASCEPSLMTAWWQSGSIRIPKFMGDNVWSSTATVAPSGGGQSLSGTTRNAAVQWNLTAMAFTAQTSATYGFLTIDYVVDFYQPRYAASDAATTFMQSSCSASSTTTTQPIEMLEGKEISRGIPRFVPPQSKEATISDGSLLSRKESGDDDWESDMSRNARRDYSKSDGL